MFRQVLLQRTGCYVTLQTTTTPPTTTATTTIPIPTAANTANKPLDVLWLHGRWVLWDVLEDIECFKAATAF